MDKLRSKLDNKSSLVSETVELGSNVEYGFAVLALQDVVSGKKKAPS